jgi:hypothetical protein
VVIARNDGRRGISRDQGECRRLQASARARTCIALRMCVSTVERSTCSARAMAARRLRAVRIMTSSAVDARSRGTLAATGAAERGIDAALQPRDPGGGAARSSARSSSSARPASPVSSVRHAAALRPK